MEACQALRWAWQPLNDEDKQMNADVIKGKWKQINGRIKERWGNLTDDDLNVAEGHSEYLAGKLQERYGWTKEKAQDELRDFSSKL
ncbi:conserved hypothetical protein [Pseudomonas sp. 9AZ]|jgi:uncharacterized protein YjbJ (UPF0337 family)|nr:conserved hypothetical protein [Pseudomonas sp. 9AZ]